MSRASSSAWRSRWLVVAAVAALPSAAADAPALRTSGSLTIVGQAVGGDAPAADALGASLDVVLSRAAGRGRFELYLEAATTRSRGGVAARFPSLNADAGSAFDADGQGRVQLSELKYDLPIASLGRLAVGLLDPTVYLDTSPIANDETTQFLAAALVNNPTIGFPDYVPGLVFRRPGPVRVRAALTASNGLADNPSATYDDLFDLADDGRGAFAALEVERGPARIGAWVNGREHRSLDGGADGGSASGIWVAFSHSFGSNTIDARLGAADRDVMPAARFASLAWRTSRAAGTFGAAVALTGASDRLAAAEDGALVEAYWRVPAGDAQQVSVLVQQVWNAGLDSGAGADRFAVVGLRLHRSF